MFLEMPTVRWAGPDAAGPTGPTGPTASTVPSGSPASTSGSADATRLRSILA
ncbi:MAG: hypothetical protein LH605_02050 [Microbacteriaceae bacterium]|nr:hypothetical protein [Microbacteriaceae bacterium]